MCKMIIKYAQLSNIVSVEFLRGLFLYILGRGANALRIIY